MSKDDTRPVPKTDREKAHENWRRYQYAKERGHDEFVQEHDKRNEFFFGDQWDPKDISKLDKSGRPHLTINRIEPIVRDMTGEFLVHRADVKFVPSNGGENDTAEALTSLYMHVANEQDFDDKELTLWLDGIITGRAYYDLRIGFDDNDMGEVRLSTPNPKNVIPDPDSDSKDPRDWNDVTVLSFLSLQDIEMLYGEEKAEEVSKYPNVGEELDHDDREQDTFAGPKFTVHHAAHGEGDPNTQRIYVVIERQYRAMETVPFFVDSVSGDVRRVPPHWTSEDIALVLEENPTVEVERRRAQVIRWTVSCGDKLLHDAISPFDEFTIIPWFPVFRRGRSICPVAILIDPQMNHNKLRSQELHIVNGTSNSGWKVKKDSLSNIDEEDLEDVGAQTGLVLVMNDSLEDVDRIQPVSIPQGMDRIAEKAERDILALSGVDDASRGVARGQTPGKAIQARREAALVSMGPYFHTLAWTRKRLAHRVMKLMQKFYTEERHLRITGRDIRGEVQDLDINEPQEDGSIRNDLTLGEYDVVITPTPQRDTEDQERYAQLKEMQQDLGINIPVHLLVEASDIGRKSEVVQEILRVNGMAEPSEEEQELQRMTQELEMEEKRASIAARMAQAKLSEARAQKVMSEIEAAQGDTEKLDKLFIEAQRIDDQRRHNEESMEIRREALRIQAIKEGLDYRLRDREIDAKVDERKRERTTGEG